MAMKAKEKALLIWILVVVAIGFLLSYFYGGALQAFEHFIAFALPSVTGLAKSVAVSLIAHFLLRLI